MADIGSTAQRVLEQRIKRRRLPSVDVPQADDPALSLWMEHVNENLRVFEGTANAPKQRFVTLDELEFAGLIGTTSLSNFDVITEILGDPVAKVKGTPYKFPSAPGTGGGDGGGHVKFLSDLLDAAPTAPVNGNLLFWNGKWTDTEDLLWDETNSYLQLANDNAINWLDPDGTTANFLRLANVGEVIQAVGHVSFIDNTARSVTDPDAYTTLTTHALAGVLVPFDQYLFYMEAIYGASSAATNDDAADVRLRYTYGSNSVALLSSDRVISATRGQKFATAQIWVADENSDFLFQGRAAPSPSNSIQSDAMMLYCLNLTQLGEANWDEFTISTSESIISNTVDTWADIGTPLVFGDGVSDYIVFLTFSATMSDTIVGSGPDYEASVRVSGGPFTDSLLFAAGEGRSNEGESFILCGIVMLEAPAADTSLQFEAMWESAGGFTSAHGDVSVGLDAIIIRADAFSEHYMSSTADSTDPTVSGETEQETLSFTSSSTTSEWGFLGGIGSFYPTSGFDGQMEVRVELNSGGDNVAAGTQVSSREGSRGDADLQAATPTGTEFTVTLNDDVNVGLFWVAPPNVGAASLSASSLVAFNYLRSAPAFIVGNALYETQVYGSAMYVTPPTYFSDKIDVGGIAYFRSQAQMLDDLYLHRSIFMPGRAADQPDVSLHGQIWMDSDGNTSPRFTDDVGNQHAMTSGILDGVFMFNDAGVSGSPGAGKVSFDNAALASVTNLFFDDNDALGNDYGWVLSNLAIGDQIVFRSESDPLSSLVMTVSAATTDQTGWWTVPVSVVSSGSSTPTDLDLLRFGVVRLGTYGLAVDSEVVHNTGTETVAGNKTLSGVTAFGSYVQLPTFTDTQLNDNSHAVNTAAGKIQGAMVYNTTQDAPVYAVGNADGSVWVDGAGTTVNTPV